MVIDKDSFESLINTCQQICQPSESEDNEAANLGLSDVLKSYPEQISNFALESFATNQSFSNPHIKSLHDLPENDRGNFVKEINRIAISLLQAPQNSSNSSKKIMQIWFESSQVLLADNNLTKQDLEEMLGNLSHLTDINFEDKVNLLKKILKEAEIKKLWSVVSNFLDSSFNNLLVDSKKLSLLTSSKYNPLFIKYFDQTEEPSKGSDLIDFILNSSQLEPEAKKSYILKENMLGQSLWRLAAKKKRYDLFRKMGTFLTESGLGKKEEWLCNGDTKKNVFFEAVKDGDLELIDLINCFDLSEDEKSFFLNAEGDPSRNIFYYAVSTGKWEVIDHLKSSFNLSSEEFLEHITFQDKDLNNLFHIAAKLGHWEIINGVLDLENLSIEKKQKMLLAQNKDGLNILCQAALNGKTEIIDKVLDIDPSILSDEQKQGLLLGKDARGYNILQLASTKGNSVFIKKVLEVDSSFLIDKQKKDLLLAQLNTPRSIFLLTHGAQLRNIVEVVLSVESSILEKQDKKDLISTQNPQQLNLLSMAIIDQDHELISMIEKQLNPEEVLTVIEDEDSDNRNAFQRLLLKGDTTCMLLLERVNPEQQKKWLQDKDKFGLNIAHLAIQAGHQELLSSIFNLDILSLEEKQQLLLAKSNSGWNIMHMAAELGNIQILEKILELHILDHEQVQSLLSAKNELGCNCLLIAAQKGYWQFIEKILKVESFTDETKRIALIEKDLDSNNILHFAAQKNTKHWISFEQIPFHQEFIRNILQITPTILSDEDKITLAVDKNNLHLSILNENLLPEDFTSNYLELFIENFLRKAQALNISPGKEHYADIQAIFEDEILLFCFQTIPQSVFSSFKSNGGAEVREEVINQEISDKQAYFLNQFFNLFSLDPKVLADIQVPKNMDLNNQATTLDENVRKEIIDIKNPFIKEKWLRAYSKAKWLPEENFSWEDFLAKLMVEKAKDNQKVALNKRNFAYLPMLHIIYRGFLKQPSKAIFSEEFFGNELLDVLKVLGDKSLESSQNKTRIFKMLNSLAILSMQNLEHFISSHPYELLIRFLKPALDTHKKKKQEKLNKPKKSKKTNKPLGASPEVQPNEETKEIGMISDTFAAVQADHDESLQKKSSFRISDPADKRNFLNSLGALTDFCELFEKTDEATENLLQGPISNCLDEFLSGEELFFQPYTKLAENLFDRFKLNDDFKTRLGIDKKQHYAENSESLVEAKFKEDFIGSFFSENEEHIVGIFNFFHRYINEAELREFVLLVLTNTFKEERYNRAHFRMLEELSPGITDKWKNYPVLLTNLKGEVSHQMCSLELADDPFTMLKIGTDISRSCQTLYSNTGMNKHLFGYLLRGENRALVVRDSNNKVIARAMLRLHIDLDERGIARAPVLMMDTIYFKDGFDLNPEQISQLRDVAAGVANQLNISLLEEKDLGRKVALLSEENITQSYLADNLSAPLNLNSEDLKYKAEIEGKNPGSKFSIFSYNPRKAINL